MAAPKGPLPCWLSRSVLNNILRAESELRVRLKCRIEAACALRRSFCCALTGIRLFNTFKAISTSANSSSVLAV